MEIVHSSNTSVNLYQTTRRQAVIYFLSRKHETLNPVWICETEEEERQKKKEKEEVKERGWEPEKEGKGNSKGK
jgi:hypothetical protein